MGHPASNRSGYRAGRPFTTRPTSALRCWFSWRQDERVHPKQSEQLVEALKRGGKTFEYIVYEGEGHGFMQKDNVLHYYATLERFWTGICCESPTCK